MKKSLAGVRVWAWALSILAFAVGAGRSEAQTQNLCNSGVCVLTWQQDTGTDIGQGYSYRTGQNLSELSITASSITSDNFGQLCSAALDGQVYAQPLVVTDGPPFFIEGAIENGPRPCPRIPSSRDHAIFG